MNPGQKMFYDFFMERVKDDKRRGQKNIGGKFCPSGGRNF